MSTSVVSQNYLLSNVIDGEIMVQLNNNTELNKLLSTHNLTLKHTISKRFNIYLLEYDNSRTTNEAVIYSLKNEKSVINVQNNHILEMREINSTIPNDTLFTEQWSLFNTGQGGGTPGADIDVTKAWDYSTGGLTAHGDTIVIAIVDGGADLNNDDLDLWVNRNEIPDNEIDDDGNGYVDDYYGWNAYGHNGSLSPNLHAVHVAGIAGARGNNTTGISGVNWNTKTMFVAGDSRYESIVVEALSYVYVMREIYDQSNGLQGAFVVADNCSFGVDGAQPDEYPIWEAMYDSLGQLGVLNVAATANKDWDIDSIGDVPTAFTTDYMISVTNTTRRDYLYSSAGYGKTTIDLGAPGTTILSLGLNNAYRTSSGTSMATPHVSGAVALLLAAADSAFIASYKDNPGAKILEIKDHILNGTDFLPDLYDITVSNGRLNVYNSVLLLLNEPYLETNKDIFEKDILKDSTDEDTLVISNPGNGTIEYDIVIENQPDWLTLDSYSGVLNSGESHNIIMYYNSTGYDYGDYDCVIDLGSDIGNDKSIPVIMHVKTEVGINDISDARVMVSPNPFTDFVRFTIRNNIGPVSLKIYNSYGSVIMDKSTNSNEDIIWNNPDIAAGVYYYVINSSKGIVKRGKLVKK